METFLVLRGVVSKLMIILVEVTRVANLSDSGYRS